MGFTPYNPGAAACPGPGPLEWVVGLFLFPPGLFASAAIVLSDTRQADGGGRRNSPPAEREQDALIAFPPPIHLVVPERPSPSTRLLLP